ncbi:hypothetical protein B7494_g3677 [Chlorociboria aeruginascens]|nr:hypothetical protein B7494_g3677 [Chlorociboria aeruginascens]
MSANIDSLQGQGQFHARVPPSEPLTTSGHAPGTKIGNDARPEFHAEVLPVGSAPSDRTFNPDPQGEIPGQALNDNAQGEGRTDALDTLGGATSADVNQGLGKPVDGLSSQEVHSGRRGEL